MIYILLIYCRAIHLNKCLLLWKGDFPSFFCLIYILSYIHYLNHSLVTAKLTYVSHKSILAQLVKNQFWTSVRHLNLLNNFNVQPWPNVDVSVTFNINLVIFHVYICNRCREFTWLIDVILFYLKISALLLSKWHIWTWIIYKQTWFIMY